MLPCCRETSLYFAAAKSAMEDCFSVFSMLLPGLSESLEIRLLICWFHHGPPLQPRQHRVSDLPTETLPTDSTLRASFSKVLPIQAPKWIHWRHLSCCQLSVKQIYEYKNNLCREKGGLTDSIITLTMYLKLNIPMLHSISLHVFFLLAFN